MPKVYYTYHIRVANHSLVQVEKQDSQHQSLGQPSGKFRYQEKFSNNSEIAQLLNLANKDELNDSNKARLLGEALFDLLFDDVLRQDFVNFYYEVVQQKKQLLRVELDIDEQNLPEVAALPWEFMCLPQSANSGTIWLGTTPDIIFSRRRSQWTPAAPIELSKNEKLKIALVVSAPNNLGNVEYKRVQEALEKLAIEQAARIELLPVVNEANPGAVDDILAREPHIFHFIGHGRLENENKHEVGEIAFVDDLSGEARWEDAGFFSQLFNRHRPGVVMLQACEGAKLSTSQAFAGVASRVVQQNIPVVTAMQYEVSNATASRFACSFYKKLAQGAAVDIAVQEGRYAIALGATQYRKRDFAAPVIFMRVQDGYLFKTESSIDNKQESLISNMVNINSSQRELFHQALMDAFPTKQSLEMMLDYRLDWKLNHIADGGSLSEIVFKLIKDAEAKGKLIELLEAAKEENPGNPKLRNL
ncbi:hypothetical protein NIES4071_56820 [Calothrix sp. NIES-4071]|nr:hypothetical protein NIES4071_56820 [Calothrix sp. NIES-4071]BAZ59989.1 hypothetical protein NIES4105_56770 [Calothrix sp. NIES-4105]